LLSAAADDEHCCDDVKADEALIAGSKGKGDGGGDEKALTKASLFCFFCIK